MALPVLDVRKCTSGDATDQVEFGRELLASLKAHGFVKLVNHGFESAYIDRLFEWNRRFFSLPVATKRSIGNVIGVNPQRGYSGIGGENLKAFDLDGKGDDFVDVKEHFDQGPRNDRCFPNQWPVETKENGMVGFRHFMETYFDASFHLGLRFLAVLETALNVPGNTLTRRCHDNHNELRLNHYPTTSIEEIKQGRVRRSGAHTDYGVLTLLFQDGRGGLEVQNRSSPNIDFVPVSADNPYELVVNVADTLQRWTNDLLPAGLHQVTIPAASQQEDSGILPERYSVAYFMKGNRNDSVGSLSEFVSEKNPAIYPDLTAIEYHKQRHAVLFT